MPHETFTRDGADLHCTVRVPMTAAALGTTVTLETLEAPRRCTSNRAPSAPPCSRCAGKGMPRLRSTGRAEGRGDLLVHLDVVDPDAAGPRQSELLRELAALRGEEQAELTANGRAGGLFSRLRDSLGGR